MDKCLNVALVRRKGHYTLAGMADTCDNIHCAVGSCARLGARSHARCSYIHHPVILSSHPGGAPNYSHFTDEKSKARISSLLMKYTQSSGRTNWLFISNRRVGYEYTEGPSQLHCSSWESLNAQSPLFSHRAVPSHGIWWGRGTTFKWTWRTEVDGKPSHKKWYRSVLDDSKPGQNCLI